MQAFELYPTHAGSKLNYICPTLQMTSLWSI